jgi:hypothetical protein
MGLNYGSSDREMNCVDSSSIVKRSASIIAFNSHAANLGTKIRRPFDVLVEGRFLEKGGEDRTAIELFIAGVRGWEADLRRKFGEPPQSASPVSNRR